MWTRGWGGAPLHVGRQLGFAPEAALEDLGLPL